MVTRRQMGIRSKRLAMAIARVPWMATGLVSHSAQQRMKLLLGPPSSAPTSFWSPVTPDLSVSSKPSAQLLSLGLLAAQEAIATHLPMSIGRAERASSPYAEWIAAFPGEHYRLLAALARVRQPALIIEIGTYLGASALALLEATNSNTRIITYDVVPWRRLEGTLLEESDFVDGRLEQRIGDLADTSFWASQSEVIARADLLFVDGPKDGVFEPHVVPKICDLRRTREALLVLDDIHYPEMLSTWGSVPPPRMDLTSFGHWSGTGLALLGSPDAPRSQ